MHACYLLSSRSRFRFRFRFCLQFCTHLYYQGVSSLNPYILIEVYTSKTRIWNLRTICRSTMAPENKNLYMNLTKAYTMKSINAKCAIFCHAIISRKVLMCQYYLLTLQYNIRAKKLYRLNIKLFWITKYWSFWNCLIEV